jgi:hypothetical protein
VHCKAEEEKSERNFRLVLDRIFFIHKMTTSINFMSHIVKVVR